MFCKMIGATDRSSIETLPHNHVLVCTATVPRNSGVAVDVPVICGCATACKVDVPARHEQHFRAHAIAHKPPCKAGIVPDIDNARGNAIVLYAMHTVVVTHPFV